jgi:hypothetical protein
LRADFENLFQEGWTWNDLIDTIYVYDLDMETHARESCEKEEGAETRRGLEAPLLSSEWRSFHEELGLRQTLDLIQKEGAEARRGLEASPLRALWNNFHDEDQIVPALQPITPRTHEKDRLDTSPS